MPYSSVEAAIRKRLSEANRTCPNVRVDDKKFSEKSRTLTLVFFDKGEAPVTVSVFAEDPQGKDVDHWPSISFRHLRDNFRSEEAYQTAIDRECLGCVTVTNSQGEEVSGPDLIRERIAARPVTTVYEFWIESKDDQVGKRLLSFLKKLFPPRGFLEVERADESVVSFDMLMTQDAFRSKGFDPTLNSGDPGARWYRWSLLYSVEAYEDNTLDGEYKQTVTRPCVEDLQLFVLEAS